MFWWKIFYPKILSIERSSTERFSSGWFSSGWFSASLPVERSLARDSDFLDENIISEKQRECYFIIKFFGRFLSMRPRSRLVAMSGRVPADNAIRFRPCSQTLKLHFFRQFVNFPVGLQTKAQTRNSHWKMLKLDFPVLNQRVWLRIDADCVTALLAFQNQRTPQNSHIPFTRSFNSNCLPVCWLFHLLSSLLFSLLFRLPIFKSTSRSVCWTACRRLFWRRVCEHRKAAEKDKLHAQFICKLICFTFFVMFLALIWLFVATNSSLGWNELQFFS